MSIDRVIAALLAFWRFLTGESERTDAIISRVFEDNFDGLAVIGEDGRIIAASKVATAMLLGSNGGSLIGRSAGAVLPTPMREAVQKAFVDGRRAVPSPMALARIGDPEAGGYIVQYVVTLSELSAQAGPLARRVVNLTFWDETDRRRREEELAYLGTHDPTTGALTRREFVKETDVAMQQNGTAAGGLSVLVVGLATFEAVDLNLGRTSSNALLRQVFGRLKAAGFEIIARIDRQSFAVSRPGRLADDKALRFCRDLIDRLTLPYAVDGQDVVLGISIGMAHSDVSGPEAESLLSHARIALATASEQQPASACTIFDEATAARLRERQNLGPALHTARRDGQMSIVYAPQCLLETGALVGVEASIRWVHPELGVVPPEQFMPLAEGNGEVVELGRWALHTACREVASWPFKTTLAFNISAAQFALVDVVGDVMEALNTALLSPHRLEIEVAEAPFLAKSDQIAHKLRQLRAFGVGLTLDEFGAGYSSLGHLARLSVDKVKIAGRFVSSLPADGEAGAVIRAVTTLSQTLDKEVVADGVETADQVWMLRMMGCRVGQGPFYGRPRTAQEMVEWYASRSGDRAAAG